MAGRKYRQEKPYLSSGDVSKTKLVLLSQAGQAGEVLKSSFLHVWREISSTAYYFLHIKTTVLNLQVLTPPNFEQFFKMVQGKAQHNPQSMMLLLRRKFLWHPSIKIKNMQMSWMQNSINYLHKKHCVYLDNLILKLNHLPRKLTTQKQTICICHIAGADETN